MFNNLKTLQINLNKPWWNLILQQKWLFLVALLSFNIIQIIWVLIPFIAAKLFETNNFFLCALTFIIWLSLDLILQIIRIKANSKFQLQCIYSIYQNIYSLLLTIDPKYHVYRSSGKVIAKIERSARGYEDFLDHITFELIPMIMSIITVICSLAYYSIFIAFVMTIFVLIMLSISYYFTIYKITKAEKEFIKKDDTFKANALENLAQIQLIRSTYASNFRYDLLNKDIHESMKTESYLWKSYAYLHTALGGLYIVSLFVLSITLLLKIDQTILTPATALGLFLVYFGGSKEIVKFGRLLRKTNRSKTAIEDLFNFIPDFGQQNFPVLGDSTVSVSKEYNTEINASNISFDYGKAVLFNDHTLHMLSSKSSNSKLYGIIGESGSGKTTLLSILGGQLKPIKGKIIINGVDIYDVNDAVRSQIIGLQGQVTTNMYGTVKNNLLLGFPENHNIIDNDLLTVLNQVGLLTILNQYNGLDTLLGEGGLNLSGGQRQRLNFAGLYLRANYYKPLLVLIDEPTSSLDEISEVAITKMIEELSRNSITLVVAHRLKTIENAIGIIDLSLLKEEKIIKAYDPKELNLRSKYYRDLISGKEKLDPGLNYSNLC